MQGRVQGVLQHTGDAGTVDFTLGALPAVTGDPVLLRQVWVNLIDNAVKFSGKQAGARVEIGCSQEAAGLVFTVCDNGAGFDMAYADKLFGVFQRLHTAAEFPGTGVGLAIVKRVVERHGGRVWAESLSSGGARLSFSLPIEGLAA